MASRCKVTVRDATGALHTVELGATSKFEAVGLALAELRKGAIGQVGPAHGHAILVEVVPPTITYRVMPAEFSSWLDAVSTNPREQAIKAGLKQRLT